MKNIFFALSFSLIFSCSQAGAPEPQDEKTTKFSFAYLTDIHLNNGDNNCFEGFEKAVANAKSENADFIMTGGDNVDIDGMDSEQPAHELYEKYAGKIDNAGIPFYPTIGNHDRFWATEEDDPLYNEGLFEKYLNESYYSFDHKDWHFIVLNSAQNCDGNYCVGKEQKQWLAADLAGIDAGTPIILSAHVPFLSVYYPVLHGEYTAKDTFSNFKEIWDMFEGKNLKLVLQGHMHLYEEIKVKDVQFITAGAVSANWWGGPYHGTEEGYPKIDINGDEIAVFSVHLSAYPYEPYDIRDGKIETPQEAVTAAGNTRLPEINPVLERIDSLMNAGIPVFLTGDFNEPSHLDWTEKAAENDMHFSMAVEWPVSKAVVDTGMKDACREAYPDEVAKNGITWTTNLSENEVHDRIDIVYQAMPANWELNSVKRVGRPDNDSAVKIPGYESDHYEIIASYSTKNE